MLVIGVTGTIGSGKSLAAAYLEEMGAARLDADSVGHQVLAPQGAAYDEVAAAFGPAILQADATIDRRALAALVFADPARLALLNQLTHPRITEAVRAALVSLAKACYPATVLEAALLFDSELRLLTDENWLIAVEPETSISRTMQRDQCSRAAAEARLAAQRPLAELTALADRVFANEGSPEQLRRQLTLAYAQALATGKQNYRWERNR